jgi:hypothetical protein
MSTTAIEKENLRLDMKRSANSDWNMAVLHILTKRVEKAYHHAHLPPRQREYFEDIVRDKFERARAHWRKGQQRVTENCVLETADELVKRITEGKDRELMNARDRERKAAVCGTDVARYRQRALTAQQKFNRRMDAVKATINHKEIEGASDTHIWRYLESMLNALGKESMSSDESDYEPEIGTFFRPKTMPWRRNIIKELQLIDQEHRRIGNVERRRGAKPVIRKRDGINTESISEPVSGLPIALYDPGWLKGRTMEYITWKLRPVNTGFKWKKLAIPRK